MASKATRTALIAVSALGTSGILAMSASAATPPTIPTALVDQPAVTAASAITPESATLNGVIDTGGNPGTTFQLPANTNLVWSGSVNLIGTAAATTEHVDGLPSDGSSMTYPTSSTSVVLNNNGANNYSTVLFEYDPLSDFTANGGNLGPETGFADAFDQSTLPGLSTVQSTVGAYPAASSQSLSGPLTPNTKYVYFIEQQAGATDAATTINTFNGSATGTNPTYTCYPNSYIAAVAPYNGYTTTGTISGGVSSGTTAQTTPQPQIQGPCVYYYGGGSNYYTSTPGYFTTPKLGQVVVFGGKISSTKTVHTKVTTKVVNSKSVSTKTYTTTLSNIKASVGIGDQSVEKAIGSVELTYHGKTVGSAKFNVSAQATKTVALSLTGYGRSLASTGKSFTSKLTVTTSTDQPSTTKSVTL